MDDNQKFWNRFAKLYGPIQERSNRALYDAVTAHAAPYLHPDTRVLELGCGSGQLTLPLWQKAGSWEATDFSPRMIEQIKKRIPEVSAAIRDATVLPYADGSFDVVLAANLLHIMPDPVPALKEVHRVLDREGILVAPTFVYEGRINRFRMKITTMVGFRSYGEWSLRQLETLVEKNGFRVTESCLLPGSPLPEGFVAAKRV